VVVNLVSDVTKTHKWSRQVRPIKVQLAA